MSEKRKKDEESFFAEFYDSCKGLMYWKAYNVLRNEADAQDAVQNALMHLWKMVGMLPREEAKLRTYAVVSAYHAAVDICQKKKHILALCENIKENIVAFGQRCGANPFKYVVAMENTSEILKCVEKLHKDYCEILMMVYYDGLSIKEVAAVLNLSEKAVTTKLCRARKALGKELIKQGYEVPEYVTKGTEEKGGEKDEQG